MSPIPRQTPDIDPQEGAADHLLIPIVALAKYGVPMVELHSREGSPTGPFVDMEQLKAAAEGAPIVEGGVSAPVELEEVGTLEPVPVLAGTSELVGSHARSPSRRVRPREWKLKPANVPSSPVAPDLPSSVEVVAECVEPPGLLVSGDGACRPYAFFIQVPRRADFLDAMVAQLRGLLRRVWEEFEQETTQHTRFQVAAL